MAGRSRLLSEGGCPVGKEGKKTVTQRRVSRESYHHGDLRQALVEAGLALAREGGPQAIVLREATRRAGVAPNAAYRHFANRQALFDAVRAAALGALAAAIEAEMEIGRARSEEHTSELQSQSNLVCRLLLEKK